jgi:hypothetical protein
MFDCTAYFEVSGQLSEPRVTNSGQKRVPNTEQLNKKQLLSSTVFGAISLELSGVIRR